MILLTIPEDVVVHIVTFLDGSTRSVLCPVSRFFASRKQLLNYDGPYTTPGNIVVRLTHSYWGLGIKTPNQYYYTTVEVRDGLPTDVWIDKLLMTESIDAGAFLCAWHHLKSITRADIANDLLRDAIATISSEVTHQMRKIQVILETCKPSSLTQNYILRMSCLLGNEAMIRYCIENQEFSIDSGVTTAVLISERFAHDQHPRILEYVLSKSTNVHDLFTDMNYWNLKYPLYNQDWGTFAIMYKMLVLHNPQLPWTDIERTICHGLPESCQLQQRAEIAQYRASLNT